MRGSRLSDSRPVIMVTAVVAFALCLIALAFALLALLVVLGGAVGDARLLVGVSPLLLLAYPVYWAGAWLVGRYR